MFEQSRPLTGASDELFDEKGRSSARDGRSTCESSRMTIASKTQGGKRLAVATGELFLGGETPALPATLSSGHGGYTEANGSDKTPLPTSAYAVDA